MATGKITKKAVEAVVAPPKGSGKREHLWDETLKGFGVMVTDRGVRSYLVQYRIGGRGNQTRRVTIGKHGSPWTADSARTRAAELLEQVRRKVDPFDADKARLEKAREAKRLKEEAEAVFAKLTFEKLADRFVDEYAKVNQPKTWKDTDSVVRRDLRPYFKDRVLPSIDHDDIVELLDRIQRERGAGAALKAYKALRSFFGWAKAKHRKHVPVSPMADIKPPTKTGVRKRTLSDAELPYVWHAAGELGWPFGPLIRLLILLGQRRDETAGIARPEVDKAKAEWLLPGERTKNGYPNLIPMSDPAMAIFNALPSVKSKAKLLFTTTGETPVSGFSKVKQRIDALITDRLQKEARENGRSDEEIADQKLQPWTFHDLRRTVGTGLERLGVRLEVTEAILNHVAGAKSGIVGVYQTYEYAAEKRGALDLWGRHVLALVGQPQEQHHIKSGEKA